MDGWMVCYLINEGYAKIFSYCMLHVCVCVCVRVWRNQSKQRAGHYLAFCLYCDLHLPLNKPPSVCLSRSAALIFPPSSAMPFIRVIFMKKDNNNKKPIWKILSNATKLRDRWYYVDLIKRRMVPQGRRFRQNKTWCWWSKASCIKQSTAERSPSLLLICRLLPHCYIKPLLWIAA